MGTTKRTAIVLLAVASLAVLFVHSLKRDLSYETDRVDGMPATLEPPSSAETSIVVDVPGATQLEPVVRSSAEESDDTGITFSPFGDEPLTLENEEARAYAEELLVNNTYGFHDYLELKHSQPSADPDYDVYLTEQLRQKISPLVDLGQLSVDVQCNNKVCFAEAFGSGIAVMNLSKRLRENRPLPDAVNTSYSMERQGESYFRFFFFANSLDVSDIGSVAEPQG